MIIFFVFFLLINAQIDVESDSLFAVGEGGSMMRDIPYARIHSQTSSTRIKTQTFYEEILSEDTSLSFKEIQCRHYKDFYYLLYGMCRQSILCSEMYYIEYSDETSHAAMDKVNFKKFVYQLSLSQLFIILGDSTTDVVNDDGKTPSSSLFLLEDNVPTAWIPRYVIRLNDALPSLCSETMDLSAEENMAFLHSSLYLLHAYKYYVVNDYKCSHYNEWLVLDAHNKPHCVCRHNKSCETESNYRVVIIILTTLMLMMIVLWIISFFVHTPKLIQKIDEANRVKLVK